MDYHVALYIRLSKEDENEGPSQSVTNQKSLLNEFVKLNVSEEFSQMFDVVIQLGAILAVIVLFFRKLNPFDGSKKPAEKKQTWRLWFTVLLSIIPSGLVGVLFDDWMDEHLHTATVVAIALIVYGVAFLLVERYNARREPQITGVYDIDLKTALLAERSRVSAREKIPIRPKRYFRLP